MYGVNNVFFSNINRVNTLRLSQALYGNKIKKPSDFYSVSNNKYTNKKPLSADEKAFLSEYKDEMNGVLKAAQQLGTGSSSTKRTASSNNTSVASATGRTDLSIDKYTVDVKSIAKEQINTSASVSASRLDNFKGGKVVIENAEGTHVFHTRIFNKGTGKDILQGLADDINSSKIGVTASLKEKDGKVSLELKSKEGKENAFTVSGKAAEELALSNVSQSASDAEFEVSLNGRKLDDVKVNGNDVQLSSRLSIKLKGEGTAEISSNPSSAAAKLDATEQLIEKFNGALAFLNDNAHRGIGVLHQMKRMIIPPVSERSLELIGIGIKKDGRFTLDKDVFTEKAEQSPELVNYILDKFSSKLQSDAALGMRENEKDLLSERGNSFGSNNLAFNAQYNDIDNMMKIYNKGGALALKNYGTIGYMMNFFI